MIRENYSSGSKWEPVTGYSRAVRNGSRIFISGTTAFGENGEIAGVNDAYAQTVQAIRNIEKALNHFGAELKDVVRTRVYVTDVSRWQEVAKAHGELFGAILPASSLIGVSWLVLPEMLVEIEAEAMMPEDE